jgi:CheY-like chemotaxis protein
MLRLRLAPLEVDTAESARLALERMASTDYDLVSTDLKMPDMDGEAFIRESRTRQRGGAIQERGVMALRGAVWPQGSDSDRADESLLQWSPERMALVNQKTGAT